MVVQIDVSIVWLNGGVDKTGSINVKHPPKDYQPNSSSFHIKHGSDCRLHIGPRSGKGVVGHVHNKCNSRIERSSHTLGQHLISRLEYSDGS